jgi:hypothetical protein
LFRSHPMLAMLCGVSFEQTLLGSAHQVTAALTFATLRDTSACTAAISQARTQAEQLKPDNDFSWLHWLDPTAITITAGNCHLLLG